MTTQEIKAIIAEKIAGQGNQVDIGGALAEVLTAIVEKMPESELIVDLSAFPQGVSDITNELKEKLKNSLAVRYGDYGILPKNDQITKNGIVMGLLTGQAEDDGFGDFYPYSFGHIMVGSDNTYENSDAFAIVVMDEHNKIFCWEN